MANSIEDEEMDSLFEGMVLFNPSQIPTESPPQNQLPPRPPSPPQQPRQPELSPSPSSSAPLDENLFSDLTLIDTQSSEPQPLDSTPTKTTPEPSSSSISRQVSRKKKKPGIRIGYGRDSTTTTLTEEHSPSTHDLNNLSPKADIPIALRSEFSSSTQRIESELQEKSNIEHTHGEIRSSMPAVEVEVSEKSDFEDTQFVIPPASVPTVEAQVLENNDFEDTQFEDIKGESELVPEATDLDILGNVAISTEQKLEQIRGRILEKIEGVRAMSASVSTTRKELARKRRKAVESVNLASLKYKEMERELEEACEAEDFEKAERVSDSLAAAEQEKEGFLSALRDAEAECASAELKMQEVLELQIAAEEEGVSLLEQFAKDAADNANLVLKNAQEISLKETTEWLSSIEAVEVKKMESEIESHLINDARSGLNDSIEHLIEDDRREQETLWKKRDILNEELEQLLALVRQKESEILENNSNILVVEQRIADAFHGFHDVQSSLDTKYNDIQLVLSRMDSESEVLSAKKKKIDDDLSLEEKRGGKLKELADISITEARSCEELVALRKSLALPILKYREVKLRLAKTEEKVLEDVQNLRQEVSAARASLQELSSARSNIQQEITSAKQRIFFIDKRSPELEAEKRVAAAARNFKEAGRIAAEAKTLAVEKENTQTKMEADILQLGKIEEEIDQTVANLNEKEELILSKEKEAAKLGCERLRLIYATAVADRSAALQLGDLEEANTLLAEAEAADSEARKLQETYDLKEEEFENNMEHVISLELVAKLGGKELAEMVTSNPLSAV